MAESGDGGEPIRPGLPAGGRRHHDGLGSTIAFTGIELARVKKVVCGFCEGRTRPEIRDRLRLEYSVVRLDVEVFEVRPHWREPGKETCSAVAKQRFVKSAGEWRLFWRRQDLKWHAYEPYPSSRRSEELIGVVGRHEFGCCFGERVIAPCESRGCYARERR